MPRTIAIGDIHGCARALKTLFDLIALKPDDTLVLLGDYVDRGPDSRNVIEQLIAMEQSCQVVALRGNHEVMLLESLSSQQTRRDWLLCGGDATVASYGQLLTDVPASHVAFLKKCVPYHETETHIFVHANYDPSLSMDRQNDNLLYWIHVSMFAPTPHLSGKVVIAGHTPQPGGRVLNLGHMIVIDTYCYGGGWLTALDVHSRSIWQANEKQEVQCGTLEMGGC